MAEFGIREAIRHTPFARPGVVDIGCHPSSLEIESVTCLNLRPAVVTSSHVAGRISLLDLLRFKSVGPRRQPGESLIRLFTLPDAVGGVEAHNLPMLNAPVKIRDRPPHHPIGQQVSD